MKKLLFTFVLGLITTTTSLAQEKANQNIEAKYVCEMKLDYEETMKTIPQQYRSQVADALKAEIANGIFIDYNFRSNGKMSTFTIEQKVQNSQSQGGMIAQQMAAFDNKPTYKDFTSTPPMYYKEVDFGVKQILIKDQIQDFKWKITREKSDINGFSVTKAEGVMMDSIKVNAWFAPSLPYKDGPYSLAGLPGLIVKADFEMNNTQMIFTLKELNISDKELKVTLPTKGDVMTEKEYIQFTLDFQKKMKEMMGSGVDTN